MLNLKNNKTLIIFVLAVIAIAFAAQNGFCAETAKTITEAVPPVSMPAKQSGIGSTAIKFLIVMGGVMLSSFIIYAGLTIYNKFFVDKSALNNNEEDDVLNTPKSAEDAVTFFIKRNKLC